MPSAAEVVVVGGGLEGCAAAWQLTTRGVTDVLVLERSTVGSGMTGKSSGIVRCHYGVPTLAAMAVYGTEVFEHASDLFSDGLDIGFRSCGYVVGVGPENVEALHANLAAQRAAGVQTETIDHATVAELWPTARLDDFAAFAHEPRGGYGDAYLTAQAFAAAARRGGARVAQGAGVAAIETDAEGVCGVRLGDGSRVASRQVVLAAGPWSVALAAPLGVDLPIRVHREEIILLKPGVPTEGLPVFSDLVSLQYVRPDVGGEILFGNSDLATLKPADPDHYLDRADDAFVDMAAAKIGHRFPGLDDAVLASSYAGCYDVTPDYNPVISTVPAMPGLVVAAGFSGHGFKISPAVGRLVADLVVDGTSSDPRVPEHDLRLARFAEGDLLRSPHPYVGAGEMR
ncbi:FAD-binding oxidoreductase [Nocardioides sp. CBS4Y-1]|uniref:FAD-binding oxidoreductase n=1 Tax=Nocardioides acrostichi TaxID=2784339 RepID=A0A930V1Z2_9ACTN|nr:FAD-binding oxidoreductase [Nocardioides acrostichi]